MEKVGLKAIFETADFQRGIQIYNSGIAQINNITINAARQSQKSQQTMTASWQATFGKIIAGIAAAIAAFKALEASTKVLQESTQLAARVEMLGIALETVGKNAGYTEDQIAAYTKAVEDKGITTQAARQSLLQMGAAEIDFAHSTDLARIAQNAARIANINSSEAFQNMIDGIQSGQVRILKNMGIMVDFEAAYKKAAKTLNTTTDALNEQQKVEARAQAVMAFGAKIAGTYEASLGTVGGASLSLARHQEQSALIMGNAFKESYSVIVKAQTDALISFRKWADEHEKELDNLSQSFASLTSDVIILAQNILGLNDTDLTTLVDNVTLAMTTLSQLIALADANLAAWQARSAVLAERQAQRWVGGKTPADELADQTRAARAAQAATDAYNKTLLQHVEAMKEADKEKYRPPTAPTLPGMPEAPDYTKAAEAISEGLDKIRKLQKDYYRDLARMEVDYNKDRAKDEQKYFKSVEKEKEKQAKQFDKATAAYEKQRAKTVADFQKQITEAESGGNKERIKAAADFARQERQERERYQLDRIQGERRYQYEKAKAVAEGDTLALEDLASRYELEKQESAENEDLRSRQAKENQTTQITEAGEAARQQLNELKQQLDEQLAEQDEAYKEQVTDQQAANAERLADMAEAYQEQTAAREEQYAEQKARRDEDHQRQLEDLGENLANQEELQKYGAENVANILQQYYGEGGVADSIMQGWHEREAERVLLTSEMLAAMSAMTGESPEQAMAQAAARRAALATHGGGQSMDEGGVVTGPAMVRVGAGVVEAFTPLGRAGGNLNVSWAGGPIPITGLERGSPSDVNQIARGLAETLTEKVRMYRRS